MLLLLIKFDRPDENHIYCKFSMIKVIIPEAAIAEFCINRRILWRSMK